MGKQQQTSHLQHQQHAGSAFLRILVLGDRSVGKSALVVRFLTKRFIGEYASGIEMAYKQEVNFAGSWISLEICDSYISKDEQDASGQLRKMAGKYDACLIVHNICDKSTFHYARRLASTIRNGQGRSNQGGGGGGKELPIVLVGNKSDLEHLREVSVREVQQVADDVGWCDSVETSAAESFAAVEAVFRRLFRLVAHNSGTLAGASGAKPSRRRKSLTQVKQMFLDHYRKHPALSSRSLSLDGMILSAPPPPPQSTSSAIGERLATVVTDNNNNNSGDDKTTKSDVPSKYRSPPPPPKCRSLGTLSEHPGESDTSSPRHHAVAEEKQSSRTLPPGACAPAAADVKEPAARRKSGGSGKETTGLWWRREESVRMSESTTEETVSLSDMSIADDDAVFIAACEQPQPKTTTRRASINRKNLKITVPPSSAHLIYSDGESPEKDDPAEIHHLHHHHHHLIPPPNSAPLSCHHRRFFPNHHHLDTPSEAPSSSSSSSSGAASGGEGKKSPTQRLLKMFFKGALHHHQKIATSFSTEQHSPESIAFTAAPPPQASATRPLFIMADNDEACNDMLLTSAAQSLFKRKERRRASLRETVGDMMRMRKRSNAAGECGKPNKDRLL